MKFYSGFSLKNEHQYFDVYTNHSNYAVCGFSYGAIKALRYVKEQLELKKRVDVLQLFSPAFFQTKDEKFKKIQLLAYRKNRDLYLSEFTKSCFAPYNEKRVERSNSDSIEDLQELLYYEWNLKDLSCLVKGGVKIEVYLGGKDKIIDVEPAKEFFLEVATVTYIKNANHFLQIN